MLAWCFQSTAPRNWALARWLHLALSGLEGLQALDFRNTSLKDPWPLSTLAALESLVSCRGLTGVSLTELVEGQQRSLEIGHKRVGDLWLLHCPELNGSGLEAGSSDWISIPNLASNSGSSCLHLCSAGLTDPNLPTSATAVVFYEWGC